MLPRSGPQKPGRAPLSLLTDPLNTGQSGRARSSVSAACNRAHAYVVAERRARDASERLAVAVALALERAHEVARFQSVFFAVREQGARVVVEGGAVRSDGVGRFLAAVLSTELARWASTPAPTALKRHHPAQDLAVERAHIAVGSSRVTETSDRRARAYVHARKGAVVAAVIGKSLDAVRSRRRTRGVVRSGAERPDGVGLYGSSAGTYRIAARRSAGARPAGAGRTPSRSRRCSGGAR